jgi:hypothetical protein
MRGFGHIKARNVKKAKAREAELLAVLRGTERKARTEWSSVRYPDAVSPARPDRPGAPG